MNLKEMLKDTASTGLVLLLAWGIVKIPSPDVPFTVEYLKRSKFILYDLNNDGNVDAIGFPTTDSFAYAKPEVKDSRVDGFTRKLTSEDVRIINEYFNPR